MVDPKYYEEAEQLEIERKIKKLQDEEMYRDIRRDQEETARELAIQRRIAKTRDSEKYRKYLESDEVNEKLASFREQRDARAEREVRRKERLSEQQYAQQQREASRTKFSRYVKKPGKTLLKGAAVAGVAVAGAYGYQYMKQRDREHAARVRVNSERQLRGSGRLIPYPVPITTTGTSGRVHQIESSIQRAFGKCNDFANIHEQAPRMSYNDQARHHIERAFGESKTMTVRDSIAKVNQSIQRAFGSSSGQPAKSLGQSVRDSYKRARYNLQIH